MADGTLKVGTITTSSGSGTITLGQSGETIAIPSGVTMTGMGKVLQVVSATSGTNDTTTAGTFVNSSLLASITPSSTSSKILIIVSFQAYNASTSTLGKYTIFRGNAPTGTNLGHATYGMSGIYGSASLNGAGITMNYLDSPSTTSSTQYTLAFSSEASNVTHIAVNNQKGSITLMEIAV